jgi:hypothetical protein
MRACIVNFRTSDADVERLPETIALLGRESAAGGVPAIADRPS